jgi:hypothetical protein
MWEDPIVEEIRQMREAHSRQFNKNSSTRGETLINIFICNQLIRF